MLRTVSFLEELLNNNLSTMHFPNEELVSLVRIELIPRYTYCCEKCGETKFLMINRIPCQFIKSHHT